jgi:hypothetical protein
MSIGYFYTVQTIDIYDNRRVKKSLLISGKQNFKQNEIEQKKEENFQWKLILIKCFRHLFF